jgi:hypothetical protein
VPVLELAGRKVVMHDTDNRLWPFWDSNEHCCYSGERGRPWDIVPGPDGKPNPRNGHCVYVCGYTEKGPVCVTWGRKQQMTWKFFTACCDEAYSIVDERDPFVKNSPVDPDKLQAILDQLG